MGKRREKVFKGLRSFISYKLLIPLKKHFRQFMKRKIFLYLLDSLHCTVTHLHGGSTRYRDTFALVAQQGRRVIRIDLVAVFLARLLAR